MGLLKSVFEELRCEHEGILLDAGPKVHDRLLDEHFKFAQIFHQKIQVEFVHDPEEIYPIELLVPSFLISHPCGHILIDKGLKVGLKNMVLREIL